MEPNKELTTEYHGIAISYDEQHNKWLFTLRGKDRSAQTLTNAKQAIDAPPPKEDKAFKRFEAWHRGYGTIERVTVTSLTEGGRFWITSIGTHGRKERTQAGTYDLFPCGEHNNAIVLKLLTKEAEISEMRKQTELIRKELRNVEPKDWEVQE